MLLLLSLLFLLKSIHSLPTFQTIYPIDIEEALINAEKALELSAPSITSFPSPLTNLSSKDLNTALTSGLSKVNPRQIWYSEGIYWHPNPKKPNGLPYIRIDGKINKNAFQKHTVALRTLQNTICPLAVGFLMNQDPRFLEKIMNDLNTWFIDSDTKVYPSLEMAQAVRGLPPNSEHSYGVLDGLGFSEIAVAIRPLIPHFPPDFSKRLLAWYSQFLDWLLYSEMGTTEFKTPNNHAVAYCVQVSAYTRLLNHTTGYKMCQKAYRTTFLLHMASNGSFPRELARPRPYHYSFYQLDLLGIVARLTDSWDYTLAGRNMSKAVEFHFPYLDKSMWPFPPDSVGWNGYPARSFSIFYEGIVKGRKEYVDQWMMLPPPRSRLITEGLLWISYFDE